MVESIDGNRPAIAEVIWEDAWVDPKDITMKEAMELLPILRSTVGYVISKDNEECLILSTDIYEKHPDIVNTPMIIPWSAIIQWWEYDVH